MPYASLQKALSLDLDAADTKHQTSRALVFCKYRRLHTLFVRGGSLSICIPAFFAIPRYEAIKKVYVEMVRQIVESEAKNDEDAE